MPSKKNNQKTLLECDRYDFTVFSWVRLKCTFLKSIGIYIIISLIIMYLQQTGTHPYTILKFVNEALESYLVISGIFFALFYSDINCSNNPGCKLKSWGNSTWEEYEDGYDINIAWFESKKEKNDNKNEKHTKIL